MILILILLDGMGIFWVVEQPGGSMMQNYGRFEWFIRNRVVYRHHIHMKDFGGESPKPTWLYSNMPWINQIDQHKPQHLVDRPRKALVNTWKNADGKSCCSGNSNTKSSQAYPIFFGEALASLCEDHLDDMVHSSKTAEANAKLSMESLSGVSIMDDDAWPDADLAPVLARLS